MEFIEAILSPNDVNSNNDSMILTMSPTQEYAFHTISIILSMISLLSTLIFLPAFCFCGSGTCEKRGIREVLQNPISRWIIIVQTCACFFCFFTGGPLIFVDTTNDIVCQIQAVGVQGSFAAVFMAFLVLTILMSVREFLPEQDETDNYRRQPRELNLINQSPDSVLSPGPGLISKKTKVIKTIFRYIDILGFLLLTMYSGVMITFPFFLEMGYGPAPPAKDYCWLENPQVRVNVYDCHFGLIGAISAIFCVYFITVVVKLVRTCHKYRVMKKNPPREFGGNGDMEFREREIYVHDFTRTKQDMGRICERFLRSFFYPIIYVVIWIVPFVTRILQTKHKVYYGLELVMFICFGIHPALNFWFFLLCRPCCCYEVCRRAVQNGRERRLVM